MPADEKDKNFLISLVEFYKETLGDASKTVRLLMNIQKKFPEQYQLLLDLQNDPSKILEITKQMNAEVSHIMINLFVQASILSNKVNRLFEISIEEKGILANDLEKFASEIIDSIKKLEGTSKK